MAEGEFRGSIARRRPAAGGDGTRGEDASVGSTPRH